jgi:hypothetical protein
MPLILIVCPPEFDRNVTALDVTGFYEALTKFSHTAMKPRRREA